MIFQAHCFRFLFDKFWVNAPFYLFLWFDSMVILDEFTHECFNYKVRNKSHGNLWSDWFSPLFSWKFKRSSLTLVTYQLNSFINWEVCVKQSFWHLLAEIKGLTAGFPLGVDMLEQRLIEVWTFYHIAMMMDETF